ncbi:MAG: Bug family tripartite tricarboxylate transporter substrate binding protein [Burkholderiaceae bacterium]
MTDIAPSQSRRRALAALALPAITAAAAWPRIAGAQPAALPNKPMQIVVPFAPGGQAEYFARLLGAKLGASLGVPVVIETRPGASTVIGAQLVARAKPDGSMLLMTNGLTHTQLPQMRSNLPYDPQADFTPIALVMSAGNLLTAHPSVPASNMQQLVAYAKANPGKLRYASIAPGSSSHLLAELLKMKAGIELTHVPYKGAGDAARDLWAGEVQLMFDGMQTAATALGAGRVRALGLAEPTRSPAFPDVPTLAEQGISGVDIPGFVGLFGPGGMPKPVVESLNTEILKALGSPDIVAAIEKSGNRPVRTTPEEFQRLLADQTRRWGEVIRYIGLRLD